MAFEHVSGRSLIYDENTREITSKIFKLSSWSFSWKCTKFYVDCKNAIKNPGNVSDFWDNGVWTCLENFCELWQEYMWAAVYVLPNSPKISHLTKRDVF